MKKQEKKSIVEYFSWFYLLVIWALDLNREVRKEKKNIKKKG